MTAKFMKHLLQTILRWLSKIILWKYKPIVIAVTGSVGKTSAKEAIFCVLREKFRVRRSMGNFNTEIGAPLTIIGAGNWFAAIFKAKLMILFPVKYSKVLVLEMAADRPGDIAYLTSFIKPDISVVTAVGPSHLEFFGTLKKIVEEKANVVSALRSPGIAVLNYDDEEVRAMADKNKGKTIFYGCGGEAAVSASNISYTLDGLTFKLHHVGRVVPVRLPGSLGKPSLYAALAAASVGISLGLNLIEISRGLMTYKSLPGRLRLLSGMKDTKVIDDTYNAAPASMLAALEVLAEFAGKRKIAVLGDMAELGEYTEDGHRLVGAAVVDRGINLLIVVGPRAKFIADQAKQMGYPEKQILFFDDAAEAIDPLKKLLQPGDVALVKASRLMRMERIVESVAIML